MSLIKKLSCLLKDVHSHDLGQANYTITIKKDEGSSLRLTSIGVLERVQKIDKDKKLYKSQAEA